MGINHFETVRKWFPKAKKVSMEKPGTLALFFDKDPRQWKAPLWNAPSWKPSAADLAKQQLSALREEQRILIEKLRKDQKDKELRRQKDLEGLPADPPYRDFYQHEWGSYSMVSFEHYEKLRDANKLPGPVFAEKVLLFREPGALFFRPPASEDPALKEIASRIEACEKAVVSPLSISAVKTVFSCAPDSVGAAATDDDNDDYVAVPKKAIRAAKQQLRASREALRALDPYVHSALKKSQTSPVSLSPDETKIKNNFTKSLKSASEAPSPKTPLEHTCRKCEASFRSRNALFDHVYSNTCQSISRQPTGRSSSLGTPRSKSSAKTRSSVITANNTPVGNAPTAAPDLTARDLTVTQASTISSAPRSSDAATVAVKASPAPVEHLKLPDFEPFVPTPRPKLDFSHYKLRKNDKSRNWGDSQPSSPGSPRPPPSPCSCRTCSKSFTSRNLLFAHLHEHGHCRPVKSQNTGWRTGKMTMEFGVLRDIIRKLAVASAG